MDSKNDELKRDDGSQAFLLWIMPGENGAHFSVSKLTESGHAGMDGDGEAGDGVWGEHKRAKTFEGVFDIVAEMEGGLLDCQNCEKVVPINFMYSVDACCEKCQDTLMMRNLPVPSDLHEYETIDGKWHMFVNGKAVRPLTDDEAAAVVWGSKEE